MVASDLVKEWLSSEGYKATIDGDGDVKFKYQGLPMWATTDENDKLFLRIIMPGIYQVSDDRGKVLEIMNQINMDLKIIKCFVVEDKVWLSVEMFVDSSPEIEDFFERCLDILVAAFEKFRQEINK